MSVRTYDISNYHPYPQKGWCYHPLPPHLLYISTHHSRFRDLDFSSPLVEGACHWNWGFGQFPPLYLPPKFVAVIKYYLWGVERDGCGNKIATWTHFPQSLILCGSKISLPMNDVLYMKLWPGGGNIRHIPSPLIYAQQNNKWQVNVSLPYPQHISFIPSVHGAWGRGSSYDWHHSPTGVTDSTKNNILLPMRIYTNRVPSCFLIGGFWFWWGSSRYCLPQNKSWLNLRPWTPQTWTLPSQGWSKSCTPLAWYIIYHVGHGGNIDSPTLKLFVYYTEVANILQRVRKQKSNIVVFSWH